MPYNVSRHERYLMPFLVVLASQTAFAHSGAGTGGFANGLAHPVAGLDHVLAMIAVGLWGAQLGQPQLWLLPITFPMMMAFGGVLGLMGMPLPLVEIGIAGSAIALGAAVLLEVRPKLWVSLVLVGFFALFHGHAHGTELAPGESGLHYSIGFVVSTGLLHAAGIGIGTLHSAKGGQLALRGAGAVVLAGGAFFMLRGLGWIG